MPMFIRSLLALLLLWPASDPVVDAVVAESRDHSRVMEYLEHLTGKIGPRLTSSTGLASACDWTRSEFEKLGLPARLEEWGSFAVGFDRGPWSAKMTVPESRPLTIGFNAWSAGTPGPVSGPAVVAPRTHAELTLLKPRLKGAWVISSERGPEPYRAAYEAAGVAGVVRTEGTELIHTAGNTGVEWGKLPTLVMVTMVGSQHGKILDLLGEGKDVQITIDIPVGFRKGPIKVHNVIAELRGSEMPDELVIVGGHLDSWDGATGATDNGTGVSTTLEAARLLTKAGARPKRTIRFMLWSGEEQLLQGSRAYIRAHPEETPKISAVLVHDGGTNYVAGIQATEPMMAPLEKALQPLLRLEGPMKFAIQKVGTLPFGIGSDHDSYLNAGVPGFYWIQAGKVNKALLLHTQNDTIAAVIPEYQRQSSMVIALAALGIADLPDLLPRAGLRAPQAKRKSLGVQVDDDLCVTDLSKEGPAEKADVRVGDRLLAFDGKPIDDAFALSDALRSAAKQATLRIRRDGKETDLNVTFPD